MSGADDWQARLARDFAELTKLKATPIEQAWPEYLDARVPHVLTVDGHAVGLAHVTIATALVRFTESHRLLTATLDVMELVRQTLIDAKHSPMKFRQALEELFAAGAHLSQHVADTDTAFTVAELEARQAPTHNMKTEPN